MTFAGVEGHLEYAFTLTAGLEHLLKANHQVNEYSNKLCWPCRGVFGALVAGMVAGLWGVTGWIGFSYYLASHAVVSPFCM